MKMGLWGGHQVLRAQVCPGGAKQNHCHSTPPPHTGVSGVLIITLLLQRGGQCPEQEGCRVSGRKCEHTWESEYSSGRGCEHSSRDKWGCDNTAGRGVNTQLGGGVNTQLGGGVNTQLGGGGDT